MVSGPLYVLQTWYVPHQHPVHCFRIECGWQPTVTVVADRLCFITSNHDTYADALDCERMPVRVMVHWDRDLEWKVATRLELAPVEVPRREG